MSSVGLMTVMFWLFITPFPLLLSKAKLLLLLVKETLVCIIIQFNMIYFRLKLRYIGTLKPLYFDMGYESTLALG